MIGGQIYFGTDSCAGEIGYFYSSLGEFQSGTMRPYELGSLEQRISGDALARQGRTAARQGSLRVAELAVDSPSKITAKTLFDAYRLKDKQAAAILKKSFAYFNMALCNVINLLAPELVIFGGGFSGSGDVLLQLIIDQIQEKVLIKPKIEVSQLHNEASIIGGIQFLIDSTDFLAEL
jgi:predicted NBD/HSP70 family sugar kinase